MLVSDLGYYPWFWMEVVREVPRQRIEPGKWRILLKWRIRLCRMTALISERTVRSICKKNKATCFG
jgi:hypothetical protein